MSAETPAVHAELHVTPAISYYATYRALLEQCRTLFAGDRAVAAKLCAISGRGLGSWPEKFGLYVAITKP
jgi:hypothetical protein